MWPRRQKAAAKANDVASSKPQEPAKGKEEDAWIVRALAKKRQSKKLAKQRQQGSAPTFPNHQSTNMATSPKRLHLKRPRPESENAKDAIQGRVDERLQQEENFENVFKEILGSGSQPPAMLRQSSQDQKPLPSFDWIPTQIGQQAKQALFQRPELPENSHPEALESHPHAFSRVAACSSASAGSTDDSPVLQHELASLDRLIEQQREVQSPFTDVNVDRTNTRHEISNNFVRLNLKKRFKSRRSAKSKRPPAYFRSSDSSSYDPRAMEAPPPSSTSSFPTTNTSSWGYEDPNARNDGLDFIEECVQTLKQCQKRDFKISGPPTDKTTTSIASTAASGPVEPPPHPRCQHGIFCQRLVVKKHNANRGKVFFACALGVDEGRCNFFQWEEDMNQVALQRLVQDDADGDAAAVSTRDEGANSFVPLDFSKPIDQQSDDVLLTNLRLVFGHKEFRKGQLWAVRRVLQGKSTLLVLPTGAGKSLCYQMPALLLPGLTLVVSPLISLMNDQLQQLPAALRAQAVSFTSSNGSSSKLDYAMNVKRLFSGHVKLVFVSPERAMSQGFQQLLRDLSHAVSLLCIDEAHCASEWSHHFRPSYLQLRRIVPSARCVLAMTATASCRVLQEIADQFRIDLRSSSSSCTLAADEHESNLASDERSMLKIPWQRSNLSLEVVQLASHEEKFAHIVRLVAANFGIGVHGDEALSLSNGNTLKQRVPKGSWIIYVHQQRHAEELAVFLQQTLSLDDESNASGASSRRLVNQIVAFHAGMDPQAKEKIRVKFQKGSIRIVIATIAFGMGIDKSNVRAVIHLQPPSSVENYVQQIGRAGRDGKSASCVLFWCVQDFVNAYRLSFSNAFDLAQWRTLVDLVTCVESLGGSNNERCRGLHFIQRRRRLQADGQRQTLLVEKTIDVKWLQHRADMKAETLETFLSLLQNDMQQASTSISMHPLVSFELKPSLMAFCVVTLVHQKVVDLLAASDQVEDIDAALLREILAKCQQEHSHLHAYEQLHTGYLTQIRLRFHVLVMANAMASVLASSSRQAAAPEDDDVDACEEEINLKRLMRRLRALRQRGILNFSLETFCFRFAFQVEVDATASTAGSWSAPVLPLSQWACRFHDKNQLFQQWQLFQLCYFYKALEQVSSRDASQCLEEIIHEYFEQDQQEAAMAPLSTAQANAASPTSPSTASMAAAGWLQQFSEFAFFRSFERVSEQNVKAIESSLRRLLVEVQQFDAEVEDETNSSQQTAGTSTATGAGAVGGGAEVLPVTLVKIMQGIASVRFPMALWQQSCHWKSLAHFRFDQLLVIATKVVHAVAQPSAE